LSFVDSSSIADENHLVPPESLAVLNSKLLLNNEKKPLEFFRPNFFSESLFSDKFVLKNSEDKLFLAANNTYFSTLSDITKRTSIRGKIKINKNYFKGFVTDTAHILTSPLRWDKSDWTTAALVAGITGTFFVFDEKITGNTEMKAPEARSAKQATIDDIGSVFEKFGDASYSLPGLLGLYVFGRYQDNEKAERTALLATESFLITVLFTTTLKSLVGRGRPFSGEGSKVFKGPSTSKQSFPSGHTSSAFSIATVVAKEYENIPLVAPISYSIATLTGLSRINEKSHWASDVFFGAAIGYLTAKTILKLHSNKKGQHFTIYPQANSRGGGLIFSNRF
jgi:membrane-associated phospholipid phosphatase